MTKQIAIMINSQDEFEMTGIVGWVELFGSSNYSIVIRPGVVLVDGASAFSPGKTRIFAKALEAAARLAENYHGQAHEFELQSNSDKDIT